MIINVNEQKSIKSDKHSNRMGCEHYVITLKVTFWIYSIVSRHIAQY